MSEFDETTDAHDPIADAIFNGFTPPSGTDVPTEVDVPVVSGTDDSSEDMILGKFKSSDDLADAYQNLEREFTQARQRAIDLEALFDEDEPVEEARPWGLSFTGDPQNEEELVGWAERDPGAAAQWALSNNARIPAETVNGLWEHWFERKPTEAMAWYTEQQTAQVRQQYESELDTLREQIAPLRDQQAQALFESSLESLEGQIPDLADYSDKIQAYVDNIPIDQLHLAFFPSGMDTPEKIQEGVRSLYAVVRMREAPMQQAASQTNQNAFTQSRQGIMNTGPSDYDAKINAAILNGR